MLAHGRTPREAAEHAGSAVDGPQGQGGAMSLGRDSICRVAAACWLVAACAARAGEVSQLEAVTIEPRAFGYQVGDVAPGGTVQGRGGQ